MRQTTRRALAARVAVFALGAALSACNVNISNRAEARDQWKRTYPLEKGGTVELKNTNGRAIIEPTDTATVDVVVDRIVNASTDEAAKDALTRFEIGETISPSRVQLDATNRSAGLMVNLSRRADFTVKVPRWASVTVNSTNGDIRVNGITGALKIETTNGDIRATALENSAQVTSTNGAISLDFVKIGEGGVRCETTNGIISVSVPKDVDARLSARVTNGAIDTSDLKVTTIEQSRRRLDGTLGKGGPEIRLETTNGMITVKGR